MQKLANVGVHPVAQIRKVIAWNNKLENKELQTDSTMDSSVGLEHDKLL